MVYIGISDDGGGQDANAAVALSPAPAMVHFSGCGKNTGLNVVPSNPLSFGFTAMASSG